MDKKLFKTLGILTLIAGVGATIDNIDIGRNEIKDGIPDKKEWSKDDRNYYYQYDQNGNLTAEILTDKEIRIPNVYISDEKINMEEWKYNAEKDKLEKIEVVPTDEPTPI